MTTGSAKSKPKLTVDATFHCLRCGHVYTAPYTKGEVVELTCPKCRSNSVRRPKKKKKNGKG